MIITCGVFVWDVLQSVLEKDGIAVNTLPVCETGWFL